QLRAGHPREAIALLSRAYEDSGDVELAQELVLLRHDAALRWTSTPPAGNWPPDVPDLFAGEKGIPEIVPVDLNPDLLASGILHHGGLIVRGLLSPEEVERCTACVRNAFAACDRHRT